MRDLNLEEYTEAERVRKQAQRARQTELQLENDRELNRDQHQLRLQVMTEDEITQFRESQRLREGIRRAAMTENEREQVRESQRMRENNRRDAMTDDEREQVRETQRFREHERRDDMTEYEQDQIRESQRVREHSRRNEMTAVERDRYREIQRLREQDRHRELQLSEIADAAAFLRVQRRGKQLNAALYHHESFIPDYVIGKHVIDGRHVVPTTPDVCRSCKAWKFEGETASKCCMDGKIQLPPFRSPPEALMKLYHTSKFREDIRKYNNVFAFTSLGASPTAPLNVDETVAGQRGVYTFRVQGALCHNLGALLPPPREKPMFAQIYFVDSNMNVRVEHRMRMMGGLDPAVLTTIESVLSDHNPFAQKFMYAGHVVRHVHAEARRLAREERGRAREGESKQEVNEEAIVIPDRDLRIRLHTLPSDNPRTFNTPTSDDVSALLVEDGNGGSNRDIILHTRTSRKLVRLFETHAEYDPLQYPLLFPYGELGWTYTTEYAPGVIVRNKSAMALREFVSYQPHERCDNTSLIHRGGRLFQQYVVDQWAKCEQERLRYIESHKMQRKYRRKTFAGLRDALRNENVNVYNIPDLREQHCEVPAAATASGVGQQVILPASFTNSSRYMNLQFLDSMAIVREYGKPDLSVTMTCNPKWPEITEKLLQGQVATDRPDLVSRVWQQKLQALLKDLDEGVLGIQAARIYVIEFQKRGLPHAHILIVLHEDSKVRTTSHINKLVSAELPDEEKNALLFETVISSMMHGPCGASYPNSPCMKDGKCSKRFPKVFAPMTCIGNDGYPVYMRRSRPDGRFKRNGKNLDNATLNQFVVPYNPFLSQKFNCHLNVEVCSTIKAVKYLYKYVYKGSDKTTVTIDGRRSEREPNEVRRYLNARYISPVEACQRLFDCPVQGKTHSVVHLPVHLPDMSSYVFDVQTDLRTRIEDGEKSMLTAFFAISILEPDLAGLMLYQDIPKKYRWDSSNKCWVRYKRAVRSIGRLAHCSPQHEEQFYLRLMLCYVKGPTSYIDLRTVDEVEHSTFKGAARASGFLEGDNEWNLCLAEAAEFKMPRQLRLLFVTILVYSQPTDVLSLWTKFHDDMSKDFQRVFDADADDQFVKLKTLSSIDTLLQANGKSLTAFADMPQINQFSQDLRNRLANSELNAESRNQFPRELLQSILEVAISKPMNDDQKSAFEVVVGAVRSTHAEQKLFFIDGPGGTGKSFLLEQILATVRIENNIALAVASSGIAALLLTGGRTAHSTFKIPIDCVKDSTCSVSKQSKTARMLRLVSLIIWDEAPMTNRFAFEAVDRMLQDVRDCDEPFGGLVVVFSGDFRQILPVVKRGGRPEAINASLKRSELWSSILTLRLTENMRVQCASTSDGIDIASFSSFLLEAGEGRHEQDPELGSEYIKLARDLVINEFVQPEREPSNEEIEEEARGQVQNDRDRLIDAIYCNLQDEIANDTYFAERAILCPTNADVHRLNEEVNKRLDGEVREYLSIDYLNDETEATAGLYEKEFLNSLSFSGIPPHKITLKVGAPIMMMRNLNSDLGLCNGTRLRVLEMRDNCISATIMTGSRKGDRVFIPRIALIHKDKELPFELRRKQFPIMPAFAMTINKAQCQSLNHLGLYLPRPVFSHGQLYVALSRVTSRSGIKIVVVDPVKDDDEGVCTKNVVYREIFG